MVKRCIYCGFAKDVGEVITVDPITRKTSHFIVCLRHIIAVEQYLRGEYYIRKRQPDPREHEYWQTELTTE